MGERKEFYCNEQVTDEVSIWDHVISHDVWIVIRFKAVLECERIVVWGMNKCNDHVSSYRAPAPSSEFIKLIQQVDGHNITLNMSDRYVI